MNRLHVAKVIVSSSLKLPGSNSEYLVLIVAFKYPPLLVSGDGGLRVLQGWPAIWTLHISGSSAAPDETLMHPILQVEMGIWATGKLLA